MYGQSYKDHPKRFFDDSWINADELRKFLSTTHCEPALSEFPEPQNQLKRELDASDRDIIQLAPHPQSEPTADNDVYNTAPTSPTVFDPADDIDDPLVWHPSDTQWMDPGLTSLVRYVDYKFREDHRSHTTRVEYLTELPSFIPIWREPTALIIDLSDEKWDEELENTPIETLIFTASIARARIVLHKLQKLGADIPRNKEFANYEFGLW
ncbi:hypothetical protein C8J57DRAFT_1258531 [Mycena rebaudengoi]|nr:hypothetical protein C8J57DRAFT_1258531 [Mycena rebaudengoi]